MVAGKQDFVAKCGSCHTLKRAGTTGVTGPNLDEAFQQARTSGFGESAFKGIVYRQILQPNRSPQVDPVTGKTGAKMPAKLFTGTKAAGRRGLRRRRGVEEGRGQGPARDRRRQALQRGRQGGGRQAVDPRRPLGRRSPTPFGSAQASAGQVEIDSENKSSIDHDIAVEGNGVNENGEVVKNGGVSKVNVDLKPGELHVLLLRAGPPRGRHGGQAHREVTAASRLAAACASSASYC